MTATKDYKFDLDPRVAEAERNWLQAIDDQRGHAEISARWDVVTEMKQRTEKRGYRRPTKENA